MAKLEHSTDSKVGPLSSIYILQNIAGKYNPADFLHEGKVALSTKSGRQTLELRGAYDRRLSRLPVRGTAAYRVSAGPAELEASMDYDRYRLQAKTQGGHRIAAAVGTRRELDGNGAGIKGRPAELDLKIGRVSASTRFREGAPKLRLDVALVDRS